MSFKLPVKYDDLDWREKKAVREQYTRDQSGLCFYCGHPLIDAPPTIVTDRPIKWSLFPANFLKYPVHLQHDHNSGLTEGSVHAYCNAVMWQYESR